MQRKDPNEIRREFKLRQTRQIIAMTAALFVVVLGAVFARRPDLFGEFSKSTLFGMQALAIGAFIGFTSYNWRCPACGKYLGNGMNRAQCGKCGSRLQ